MTVSTEISEFSYTDGGPGFPIPFRFLKNTDISALIIDPDGGIEQLTGAQFSVTGEGSQQGGTFTSSYASSQLARTGYKLTIYRDMVATQPTDLRNQGPYFAETHETVFDRLTMLIQQGLTRAERSLSLNGLRNRWDFLGLRGVNVGAPINPDDAATKGYVDTGNAEQDSRIDALSAGLPGTNHAFPWSTITTTGTKALTPGFDFTSAVLYINGIAQTYGRAFSVANNQIVLAQAIPAGTEVYAILGQMVVPSDKALKDELAESSGAGLVGFSHDQIYPPSTAGFRFKRSLHSKDAPFNCAGDGVTDDSDGLVALFAMSRALGGKCEVVIDDGIHCCNKLLQCTSNTTVRFVGSLKCTGNPASGTDTLLLPVNGASNVTYINPTIDLNFIPAVNGVICRTGNAGFMSIGGEVKNGRHEKGGTEGGRALIVESLFTSLSNRAPKILGLRAVNCYMGLGLQGGSGTATTPVNGGRSLVLVDNLSIEDCDVGVAAFGVPASGSSFTYPYAPDLMHGVINFVSRNTGKNTQYEGQDGVFVADRGCNLEVNFSSFNTEAYGPIGSVVRGNFAKCRVNGTFYGAADSAICFSPYKESDGGPASENTIQDLDASITVHGTVAEFIKNTAAPASYVVRSRVSGSATVITNARAVPANFIGMTSLHVDLIERTQNSEICGMADQVGGTLFSALPGKKIDLDLARIGPIDIRGDSRITSFAPREYMIDQSGGAKDLLRQWDSNTFLIATETTAGTDVFDKKIQEYNDGTGVGFLYSAGNAVMRWSANTIGLPRAGNYANDAAAATAGVAVGEIYRNGNVLQIRVA